MGCQSVAVRIQLDMNALAEYSKLRIRGLAFRSLFVSAVLLSALYGWRADAQDAQGPLTPAPSEEHTVRRLGTEPEPPAPPSLPPDEIIRRFSEKEDQFFAARPGYGFRKTIRIDEFGQDGKPAGQFLMVTETTRAANGQVINKVVQKPQSTLHYFNLETEDVRELDRIPAFPLTTSQLVKYDLKYIGEDGAGILHG